MQARIRIAKVQVFNISLHRSKVSQASRSFNSNAHSVSFFVWRETGMGRYPRSRGEDKGKTP